MKWVILFVIRLYWVIPKKYRRSCLFKESCSHFVYKITKEKGFICGIGIFMQRRKQCRSGYQILVNVNEVTKIRLADGSYASEIDLSEKMLKEVMLLKSFLPTE